MKAAGKKEKPSEVAAQISAAAGAGAAVLELFSQGEFEEGAKLVRARRMPQLAERLGFDGLMAIYLGRRSRNGFVRSSGTLESTK
jgi:hypothetical protein